MLSLESIEWSLSEATLTIRLIMVATTSPDTPSLYPLAVVQQPFPAVNRRLHVRHLKKAVCKMGISTRCKLPSSRARHASPTNYLTSVLLVILFVLFLLVIVIILVVFCITMNAHQLKDQERRGWSELRARKEPKGQHKLFAAFATNYYLTFILLVVLFVPFLLVIVIILVVFCIKMKCTSLRIKKEEDDRNLEQGRNQQATLQASINCLLPLQWTRYISKKAAHIQLWSLKLRKRTWQRKPLPPTSTVFSRHHVVLHGHCR